MSKSNADYRPKMLLNTLLTYMTNLCCCPRRQGA